MWCRSATCSSRPEACFSSGLLLGEAPKAWSIRRQPLHKPSRIATVCDASPRPSSTRGASAAGGGLRPTRAQQADGAHKQQQQQRQESGEGKSSSSSSSSSDGPVGQWGVLRQLGLAASCIGLCCSLSLGSPVPLLGGGGPAQARARLDRDEQMTVDLFKRNTPSVVYITNLAVRRDAFTMDFMEIPQGAGSGFVWDRDGHIVTNYHVVKGASDVQARFSEGGGGGGGGDGEVQCGAKRCAALKVALSGGREYTAQVVGFDPDKDVAVLKIDLDDKEEDLRPLKVGTSADLLVGQRVYAIGNPFGLDHTLTTGVISGTGREINSGINGRPISDVIQTDAAINPGNSGGPLLDSDGSLIGINTAIYSPSGANSGVGFAIPVDLVKSSVQQIIQYGKVVRPVVGIAFAPDTAVEQLGVKGVLVLDAREGGPASKAGIKGTSRDDFGRLVLGDIIVEFNGNPVRSASDLYRSLDKCRVGDMVDIQVLRGSEKMAVPVTLEASG